MRILFTLLVLVTLTLIGCYAASNSTSSQIRTDHITDHIISGSQIRTDHIRIRSYTGESKDDLSKYKMYPDRESCHPVFVSPATGPGQSVLLMLSNRGDSEARVQLRNQDPEILVPSLGYKSIVLPRPELYMEGAQASSLTCIKKALGLEVSTIQLGSCAAYLKLPTSSAGSQYEVISWMSQSSTAEHIVSVTAATTDVVVELRFPPGSCKILYKNSLFLCGDTASISLEAYQTISFTSNTFLTGTYITANQGPVSVFTGSSNLTVGPSSVLDQTISELLPLNLWGTRYALPSIPENDGAGYSVVITSGTRNAGITIDRVSYMSRPLEPLVINSTDNRPMYIVADAPIQVMQFVRGALVESDSGAPASIMIPPLDQYYSTYSFTNPPGYTHYLMIIIESAALGVDNNNQTNLLLDGAVVNGDGWKEISGTSLVTRNIKLTVEGFSEVKHKSGAGFGAFRYSFERGNCAYAFPAGIKALSTSVQQTTAARGISSSSLSAISSLLTTFHTEFPSAGTTFFPSAGSNRTPVSTPPFPTVSRVPTDFENIQNPTSTALDGLLSTFPTSFFPLSPEGSSVTYSKASTSFPTLLNNEVTGTTSSYSSRQDITTVRTLPTEPSVGCRSDNLGLNFLVAFMENLHSGNYNLEIYPTTFSGLPNITVDVSTPLATPTTASRNLSEEFLLGSGQMHIVNVPFYLEMVGIERAAKAVQILSTERIGVYGMNSVNGSCDGFLAFPVSSLGTEYYCMAYFPPNHKSQIGLIATHNNTLVNITLRAATRPGFNLLWDGKVYTNGDTISIMLDEYETVQLQDNTDLTGTRVTSNRPLAVFSGNDYSQVSSDVTGVMNPSHLVDQIPPIDYWGYTFYAVPIPESEAGFMLKVVGAYPSTTVTVQDSSPGATATSFTLAQPGDFRRSLYPSGMSVRIIASRPLLVGLFAGSNEESHPAMMILPPAELFKSWYTFSTGHTVFSNFSHFVLVVIDRSALPGLTINGELVEQSGWTLFPGELEKVGKAINISSGVHLIRQMDDIPFGAYIYGYASSNCAYAYPAGLCLGSADSTTAPITTTASYSTSSTVSEVHSTPSSQPTTQELPTTISPTNEAPSLSNITDCSCLTLESALQPLYAGFYYRAGRNHEGSPFYQSYDCEFYIYTNPQSKSWLVGPTLGGNSGAILAPSSQFIPVPNITEWSAYSSVNRSFIIDTATSVECSCPAASVCQTVEILNTSSGFSYFDGVFERLNSSRDGRPVFRHESGELYLFYVGPSEPSSACQYWTVGRDPDSRSGGVLRLYTQVRDPNLFDPDNSIWLEYDATIATFREQSNLRLECYLSSTES